MNANIQETDQRKTSEVSWKSTFIPQKFVLMLHKDLN